MHGRVNHPISIISAAFGLRRYAKRLDYRLKKSVAKKIHLNNLGGYMIIDPELNCVVRGADFELELDDVANYLEVTEEDIRMHKKAASK